MPGAWLILPTYNEAENIEAIVSAALAQLRSTAGEHRILIVDDGSPDGTGEIADRLAAELAEVRGAPSPGQGRPRAARTWPGSSVALDGGADLVLEMDADFSHDPGRPSPPDRRGRGRRPRARLALRGGRRGDRLGLPAPAREPRGSAYARIVLGVPVRDLTGGFKCFRRAVLEALDLEA